MPGLPDRIRVGVLTAAYPPDLVDAAVETWDARELRKRDLPARLMVYYAMAMTLFMDCGYGEVWNKLLTGLAWARTFRRRREARMQPSPTAISKARVRLGWEPMAELPGLSMVPAYSGPEQAPWAYWRGLRKLAIDGFTMNARACLANDAEFGRPSNEKGEGAFARRTRGGAALQEPRHGPPGGLRPALRLPCDPAPDRHRGRTHRDGSRPHLLHPPPPGCPPPCLRRGGASPLRTG
ncbi:transposase domain-containing protein [Nonomuraea sp. NN258]|nr:transposase domain-containing protein [Nonomuraea antri]